MRDKQNNTLYYRYDCQDEDVFAIETLQEMKDWLEEFWRMYPNDDMDDTDIEELAVKIQNSDEVELIDRLHGVGFNYETLDESDMQIKILHKISAPPLSFEGYDFYTDNGWFRLEIDKATDDKKLLKLHDFKDNEEVTKQYNIKPFVIDVRALESQKRYSDITIDFLHELIDFLDEESIKQS